MLLHVLGSLGASSGAVMAYALLLVLRPRPWWDAPYAIAVLAYLLGNALSCVAAGLSSVVQELTLGAPPIVIALFRCYGANLHLRHFWQGLQY